MSVRDDPRIQALNDAVRLPHYNISIAIRAGSDGLNAVFSRGPVCELSAVRSDVLCLFKPTNVQHSAVQVQSALGIGGEQQPGFVDLDSTAQLECVLHG